MFLGVLWFLGLVISLSAAEFPADETEWNQPRCHWNTEASFADNLDCILSRQKRQAQPDYDIYGHPCTNFARLHQPYRGISHGIDQLSDSAICDRTLKRRWYRFEGPAGGVMPEHCVEEYSCGTHAPIWLNGRHPSRYGEIQDVSVCVSLAGNCCARRWYIKVANCGEHFSYLLTNTPGCFMAYCAGEQSPCPPGLSSLTGYTPGCSDDYPKLKGQAELHVGEEGHQTAVYCDFDGPIPVGSAIETEWYVDGDNSGRGDEGRFPVFVDTMRGRRRSVLEEGHWMGKMGSTIFCRMRASWLNRTGVPSPYMMSRKHWAGIKIARRVIEVAEDSGEAVIQMQSTMPIACLPQFEDVCKITVEIAHDPELGGKQCIDGRMQQVVFGDCSVDITPANWKYEHNVSVKAVRDFYQDGTKNMRVNFRPVYSTLASGIWNDYKLPDLEVIAKDVRNARCTSTGDPHYQTFDGLYYHVYLEGEFVLYKNTRLPIQVNTRLEECGKTVSCNCGVAVKAGDDVVVIDRCQRRKRNLAFGASFPEGWRTLHRHALEQGETFVEGLKLYEHDDGRRYTVHLPTGAYIDFRVGEHWVNIYLHASSDDWRSTLGLCGTFDENMENDLTFPDGRTTVPAIPNAACGDSEYVCRFAEEWRVSREESFFNELVQVPVADHEFFNDQRYCKCQKSRGLSDVICNYHYDVHNCQAVTEQRHGVDKTSDVKIRSRSRRQKRDAEEEEEWTDDVTDYFDSEFVFNETYRGQVPTWPTPSGITESYAHSYCYDIILKSRVSQLCRSVVFDSLSNILDECKTDIKVTDDLTWAMSALTTLTDDCIDAIHQRADMWETPGEYHTPQADEPEVAPETKYEKTRGANLLADVCPGDCNQRGTCSQGKCDCSYGYEGEDCSSTIFNMPKITHMTDGGVCDLSVRPCERIRVEGTGFRNVTDLRCHFRDEMDDVTTTPGNFTTFEEIFCPVPRDLEQPHVAIQAYTLFLTVDGYRSNDVNVLVYNSRCYQCDPDDPSNICVRLPESCVIESVCYGPGQKNIHNCCEQCEPDIASDRFTPLRAMQPIVLFPQQINHSIVHGDSWQMEFQAFGGSGCEFHYSTSDHKAPVSIQQENSIATVDVSPDNPGYYTFDMLVKDACGPKLMQKYGVKVETSPSTEAPQRGVVPANCKGNEPPSFKTKSKKFVIWTNQVLEKQMQAFDTDYDVIEYYVIKNTESYISISVDGFLRYHASDVPTSDKLTILALDPCDNQAFLTVRVHVKMCPCANGGACAEVNTGSKDPGCVCPAGYSGDRCNDVV